MFNDKGWCVQGMPVAVIPLKVDSQSSVQMVHSRNHYANCILVRIFVSRLEVRAQEKV